MNSQPLDIYKLLSILQPEVKRVVLMCAIKSIKQQTSIHTIRQKEYSGYMNNHSFDYYAQLMRAGDKLENSTYEINGAVFRFARKKHYNSGMLTISFNQFALSLIHYIARVLTIEQMLTVIRITKDRPNRLLLMIMKQCSKGNTQSFDITIDNLIEFLEAKGKVGRIKDFRRNFWDSAANTVMLKSPFKFVQLSVLERRNRRAYLLRVTYRLKA